MWKTNDPAEQPYVDQFNQMVDRLFEVAETLDVMPCELTLLVGSQPYSCLQRVTDHRTDVMVRALHGANIVLVRDMSMYEVVIGGIKAANVARERRIVDGNLELKRSTDYEDQKG